MKTTLKDFLNEEIYIGVYDKNEELIGVFNYEKLEDIETKFIDELHDLKFIIKPISKEIYDEFDSGDELTVDDLKKGNFRVENKK